MYFYPFIIQNIRLKIGVNKLTLEWKKCENCGFLQHPTHLRCLNCKNQSFLPVKAKGDGRLITYTRLTALPAEFRHKSSYILGIVEFENGVKMLGQIDYEGNLELGMRMKPFQEKICGNLNGQEIIDYIFRPIE